jgi:CHAD domain-containing protein
MALQRYLEALRQEVDGVRLGQDIECIHRMRVASRRMRSGFELFTACLPAKRFPVWEKQIRQITSALGAARDTDVQMECLMAFAKGGAGPREKPGVARLTLRLRQKRQGLQVKVSKALDRLEDSRMPDELRDRLSHMLENQAQVYLYSPALYQRGYESISAQLEQFLSYEKYVSQPEAVEELHMLRIAAKRLRYTLEIFASLYPGELKDPLQACKKVQELLGDLHDCDVWIATLPEFLTEERRRTQDFFGNLNGYFRLIPGIECFLANRRQARDTSYQDFYAFWQKNKSLETWEKLHGQIQIPYFRGEVQTADETVQPLLGDSPA